MHWGPVGGGGGGGVPPHGPAKKQIRAPKTQCSAAETDNVSAEPCPSQWWVVVVPSTRSTYPLTKVPSAKTGYYCSRQT
jgi:hypothetical protein